MPCYVIVTCRSMLWTLLTVLTSLATLYCLVSPNWLVGFERPYDKPLRTAIDSNSTTLRYESPENVKYYSDGDDYKAVKSNLYKPTIGLYNRCIRTMVGEQSKAICGSFAYQFGEDDDTFPVAWQAGMVLFGIASILLVFVTISSILSLCVRDFCKKSLFTISGLIQVIAGLFLVVGAAIYPVGWKSIKVRYYCGAESKPYEIGDCSLGWPYIVLMVTTLCTFAVGMLSIQADRATSKDEIEDEILEGKQLICIQ